MTALFPTRNQEAWRYADLEALKPVWSDLAEPQRIEIAAQQKLQQIWMPSGDDSMFGARIMLAAGADVDLRAQHRRRLRPHRARRVAARKCALRAHAANIGSGHSNLEIVTTVRHVEPAAVSRQTVRSVLGGKAIGTYLGKVEVARGAQLPTASNR